MFRFQDMTAKELRWMASHNCPHGHKFIEHPRCYEKHIAGTIPPERIGFLDIETSNLSADFGIMLSYAVKEHNGKVFSGLIKPQELNTPDQDKRLVTELVDIMEKFDRVVTFYGRKFDIPYIRTRALSHGVYFPGFGSLKHTDLYYWAKFKMKLHSNRLAVVAPFLNIPAKGHVLDGNTWTRALAGHQKSLDYILIHNIEDVISTEQLFERLLPFHKLTNTCM